MNNEPNMTPQEGTGGSYSQRETELIRELVQSRLEQKRELEFESLEGYELPPRSQFSMLNKPAVSIKYGHFNFNMACIRLFEGVQYILPFVHPTKRRLTVVCCHEEESASVEWARLKGGEKWVNKSISNMELCEKLYRRLGWDRTCRYKILGRVANSERGLVLVFDLPEAIMFTPLPAEYVDPNTGEVKKRQVKYYPDAYKDHIGKSYNDYVATQQLNLFEPLEEYTGKTYGDAVEAMAAAQETDLSDEEVEHYGS